jgi:hypothetical protein
MRWMVSSLITIIHAGANPVVVVRIIPSHRIGLYVGSKDNGTSQPPRARKDSCEDKSSAYLAIPYQGTRLH